MKYLKRERISQERDSLIHDYCGLKVKNYTARPDRAINTSKVRSPSSPSSMERVPRVDSRNETSARKERGSDRSGKKSEEERESGYGREKVSSR